MRPSFIALVLATMTVTTVALAGATEESEFWNAVNLGGREEPAMAFDAGRGRIVLFGGFDSDYLGDTWEWDGAHWIPRSVSGPSSRYQHAMAYDSARHRIVLFGGRSESSAYLGDTWEFDGNVWTQIAASGPSPRREHAMTYDAVRGRVVLFGGYNGVALNDTWEWDGAVWSLRATSGPPPRYDHALAYDAGQERVVLFGGRNGSLLGDTWDWDGNMWTQSASTGPAPRKLPGLEFDSARTRVVIYGGIGASNALLGDTWEWNGYAWTQVATTGPPAGPALLARDVQYGRTIFLGYDGDTWGWDGDSWNRLQSPPEPRSYFAMDYDKARDRIVVFGGSGYGDFGDTWEWDGSTWTRRATTGPPVRWGHAMAYDSARGVSVLFGGSPGSSFATDGEDALQPENLFPDTWEWNGATWSQRSTTGPQGRYFHAMAYDAGRGRVVLFGGSGLSSPRLGDTWEWDGTTWLQRSSSGPPPRAGAAMVYDTARSRTVLYGGNSLDSDTWEWDGVMWIRVATSGPSPRNGQAMAYDALRGKTVLFSGHGDYLTWAADTWEWDGLSWVQTASGGPLKRDAHAMAFDSLRGSIVLFGGIVKGVGNPVPSSDTWEYCPTTTAIYYLDEDGDGFGDPRTSLSACARPPGYITNGTDCDDAHTSVHLGAPEISDGIDNQCPGDAGYGPIDELDDSAGFDADKITLTWLPQSLATGYEVARADHPDFMKSTCFSISEASMADTEVPASGSAHYYLVRSTTPHAGSWGRDSAGHERIPSCSLRIVNQEGWTRRE